jgi:hypothetical protein
MFCIIEILPMRRKTEEIDEIIFRYETIYNNQNNHFVFTYRCIYVKLYARLSVYSYDNKQERERETHYIPHYHTFGFDCTVHNKPSK